MPPPDLPPSLVAATLAAAGIDIRATPDGADGGNPAGLGAGHLPAHPVLRYAVTEDAELYRRIMRVLYLEHQSFGLRLRTEQVADRLRGAFGLHRESEWVEGKLEMLVQWGALDHQHDAALARTAAEFRRNRYTYDITPRGRIAEGLLAQLDAVQREHGRLDSARIPEICKALHELADELASQTPDGGRLRSALERVLGALGELHTGALAFMKSLDELVHRSEQVDEAAFERTKGALIDHLRGFRNDRRRWATDVLDALDRVALAGGERLVSLIVEAEEFVELPGGVRVAEQRAAREDELRRRWRGVRAWFLGEDAAGSPWRTLNERVIDAIRAVLDIAERLIERRSTRVDRAHVLLHLANQAAGAAPGEAATWVRAAFGLCQPRHVGVPELDAAQVADRGRTSWSDAPAAPVVAYLRRPGTGAPGRGRGAPIADLSEGRRRLAERRRRERAELDELLRRFGANGPLRLSRLSRVDTLEFSHLLEWISRAYEATPGPGRGRRATSSDGRIEILLHEPADGSRATLHAPHGRLETPDYVLEVVVAQ